MMNQNKEWTPEAEEAWKAVTTALTASTSLALPDYKRPFVQTVDCKGTFMTSVLLQKHEEKCRPVAYYLGKLDSVAQAMPHCLKAVVAATDAVQSGTSVALFHNLTLLVPHAVSALFLETK